MVTEKSSGIETRSAITQEIARRDRLELSRQKGVIEGKIMEGTTLPPGVSIEELEEVLKGSNHPLLRGKVLVGGKVLPADSAEAILHRENAIVEEGETALDRVGGKDANIPMSSTSASICAALEDMTAQAAALNDSIEANSAVSAAAGLARRGKASAGGIAESKGTDAPPGTAAADAPPTAAAAADDGWVCRSAVIEGNMAPSVGNCKVSEEQALREAEYAATCKRLLSDDEHLCPICANPSPPYDTLIAARCAFSDRNLHSRMPLDPTHVRLK
jgi:hypothetical protein